MTNTLRNIGMMVLCLSLPACASNDDPNQAPAARFRMSPIRTIFRDVTFFAAPIGATSMEITFDASESTDPDNDALTYFWDFADGSTGEGKIVTHTYTFTDWPIVVSLTVTDAKGASDTAETRIHVGPTVTPP